MTSSVWSKLFALKNVVAVAALVGALFLALSAVAKVPQQLEAHQIQADSMLIEQRETNGLLRQLLCIQAQLDTPLRCVLIN